MSTFQFKQFEIQQDKVLFKVNVDAVLLAAWANVQDKTHGLDIGTGTGVIALACCQRNDQLEMDAIEIDDASANQALQNFKASKFHSQLKLIHKDLQSFALSSKTKYDFIISNPPYFQYQNSTPAKSNLQFAKHTNKLSFEDLLKGAIELMTSIATFNLILPDAEGKLFIDMASKSGLHLNRITKVSGRIGKPTERLLMCFSFQKSNLSESELTIQKTGVRHDYTDEYVKLVKDFYTIL